MIDPIAPASDNKRMSDAPPDAPPPPPAMILVIDDESPIQRFLRVSLEAQGYQVVEASTGKRGLIEAASRTPDLIVLDLGLPDIDGIEVTRQLREWSKAPIIVVSARGKEQDKIAALDAGADDYLTKPFGVGELMARVRVALRHAASSSESGEPIFDIGDLHVDLARREVTAGGRAVHLTPNEFKLLAVLVKHAGKVLTHRQLLKEVWGPGSGNETHYLRVYMNQLRQKIEADPAQPKYLLTEPGVGYRLFTRA
jgi:two-component system KDP operon response regulator KdpE